MSQLSPNPPRLGDRSLFPDLEARAYLAHAAISPASLPVRDAVRKLVDDYARRGVRAFPAWEARRAHLRVLLARLLNADASEIALTPGTTRGITDLALSIPWQRGDRILCMRGEFPANVTPWQRAAELFGLEILWLDSMTFVEDTARGLEGLSRELTRGVRVVAVSAVQFQTGLRMPIEAIGELCRRYGTELAVDAIQACGAVPVDVVAWGADYVASGAHKWLMGLEGGGFLWVHPDRVHHLKPYTAGWLSHEHAADFLFKGPGLLEHGRPLRKSVTVFEGSTCSAIGFAALEASVDSLLQIGVQRVYEHVQAYHDRLEGGLLERGFTSLRAADPSGRSASLSVRVPGRLSAPELHAELLHHGIVTSIPDGYLRFAPHWPNGLDEIPEVLAAIDAAR